MTPPIARIAAVQAVYFAASGVWPLAHMESFERVLGRKRERWLVRTVSLLVLAIAGALGWSLKRGDVDENIKVLGILGAFGPGIISAVEGGRGRISRVYLIDAVAELALIVLWARSRVDRSAS